MPTLDSAVSIPLQSPPLPRAHPIERLHEILSHDAEAEVQSVSTSLDGLVINLAAGLATALEATLIQRHPELQPRCRGYVKADALPICLTIENACVLHVMRLSLDASTIGSMTMLAMHDALLERAELEIARCLSPEG